jgi:UDP-glucose 4-epimerase
MNRVLVTGGAGTVGAAVVRRLLSDPDYEVRVSDPREAPTWMREGCEVHRGDLRTLGEARKAIAGCSHVIHLAALTDEGARPHTLVEVNNALYNAVVRAALDEDVARFVYGSSSAAVRLPESAYGFSKLTGEVYCRTAHEEHGLPFTICRPWDIYGPGEPFDVLRRAQVVMRPLPLPGADAEPRWPLHVDDAAAGIVAALSHPEALNEELDFAGEQVALAELARLCWEACGNDPKDLELRAGTASGDGHPEVVRTRSLLEWEPDVELREGLAGMLQGPREQDPIRT